MYKIEVKRSYNETLEFEGDYVHYVGLMDLVVDKTKLVLVLPSGGVPIRIEPGVYEEIKDAINPEEGEKS